MYQSGQYGFEPNSDFGKYYEMIQQERLKKQQEKKKLKKLSLYAGGAVLSGIIIQNIFGIFLEVFKLYDKYLNDAFFASALDIIITVTAMLLPFIFFGKKMKKVSGAYEPIALGKPPKASYIPLAVVAGIGFCMLSNIATAYITVFIESFKVSLSSPNIAMADGVGGIVLTFLRIAVTAAVVEELSIRGYIMGNLRHYGDSFAIVVSSIVFALMHGNLIQAPFALLAGIGLGYLSVKTGTLWTGIIIHFFNNAISVSVTYAMDYFGEQQVGIVYSLVLYGFIFLGALCFGLLQKKCGNSRLSKGETILDNGEKIKAFFLTPTMILSVIYMLYITATYVSRG